MQLHTLGWRCYDCGQPFRARVAVAAPPPVGWYADTLQAADGPHPRQHSILVCPGCGCADHLDYFELLTEPEPGAPRSPDFGYAAWRAAAQQYAAADAAPYDLADIWLGTAQLARLDGARVLARDCRQAALDAARAAWADGTFDRAQRLTWGYLIGELLREQGQFAAALAWWAELPAEIRHHWRRALRVLVPLAEAGDARVPRFNEPPATPPTVDDWLASASEDDQSVMHGLLTGGWQSVVEHAAPSQLEPLAALAASHDEEAARAALNLLRGRAPVYAAAALRDHGHEPWAAELAAIAGDLRHTPTLLRLARQGKFLRSTVLRALAQLGDRRALDPLRAWLTGPRYHRGVPMSLVWLAGAEAEEDLWAQLAHRRPAERAELQQALHALADFDDERTARFTRLAGQPPADPPAEPEATPAPAPADLDALRDRLPTLSGDAQRQLMLRLARHGEPLPASWIDTLLASRRRETIIDTCRLIVTRQIGAAVEPLIARLKRRWKDPTGELAQDVGYKPEHDPSGTYAAPGSDLDRAPLIWALGRLRDRRGFEPLLALTDAPAAPLRPHAVRALGRLGDPRAREPLLAWATDPAHPLWADAVAALGDLGDPAAVPPLLPLLHTLPSGECSQLARALAQLGGPEVVAAFVAHLEVDTLSPVFWFDMLAETGDPAVLPHLLAGLDHRYKYGIEAACRALGKLGDPAAIPALWALLASGRSYAIDLLASETLHALGAPGVSLTVGDTRWYAPPLLRALGDEQSRDHEEALAAIRHPGAGVFELAVVRALLGDDPKRQAGAVRGWPLLRHTQRLIGRATEPAGVDLLTAALAGCDEEWRAHEVCAWLLETDTNEGLDAVLAALTQTERRELRVGAIMALGPRPDPRATATLLALLDDPDPGLRAVVCGSIADPRAAERLRAATTDAEPRVRATAMMALARLLGRGAEAELAAADADPDDFVREAAAQMRGMLARAAEEEPPPRVVRVNISGNPGEFWQMALSGRVPEIAAAFAEQGYVDVLPALLVARAEHRCPDDFWTDALANLAPHGAEAVAIANAYLDHHYLASRRAAAAEALPALAGEAALPALLSALAQEATPMARAAIIAALARVGSPTALPAMLAHAGDDSAQVRLALARACALLPGDDARAAAESFLADPTPLVRRQALTGLRTRLLTPP